MVVAWRRVGILLLALLVALPAATVLAQRGGEGGPIPERQTTCWDCHVAWPTPLKTFYNIVPPPQAGAGLGEPFEFVVQLQGAWVPPGDGPYIHYFEPALDLTAAPSLDFVSNVEPKLETLQGAISVNPATLAQPQSSFQVTEIPVGSTRLDIRLVPNDTNAATGPDLTLNIYPGVTQPTGSPAASINLGTRGAVETFSLATVQDFSGFGYGNYTVEAVATPAQSLGPSLNTIGYSIEVDASAESTGERIQIQPTRQTLAKGASILFRYQLQANAVPAPGEVARLLVNATVYYEHTDGSTDNYANITKSFARDIEVTSADPRIVLNADLGGTTVVGAPVLQNGASLDTVSEAVGYGSAFLLIASIWTGGMFGKASRRQLNTVFGTAKRRVAFHNFLSYGLILFASLHTILFIVEAAYHWTLGLLWGGPSVLAMFGLGVTGALQVQMIRRWNYGFWRWSHYGLAVAAIVFTLVHMALDGVHFGFIQEAIGWNDPLDPRNVS